MSEHVDTEIEVGPIARRLSEEAWQYFKEAAAKRGKSLYTLILDLLETIAEDDMANAVLDDGE